MVKGQLVGRSLCVGCRHYRYFVKMLGGGVRALSKPKVTLGNKRMLQYQAVNPQCKMLCCFKTWSSEIVRDADDSQISRNP